MPRPRKPESDRFSENVYAAVTEEMKDWVQEQAEGPIFESEGAVVRAAIQAMMIRGALSTLEELQED